MLGWSGELAKVSGVKKTYGSVRERDHCWKGVGSARIPRRREGLEGGWLLGKGKSAYWMQRVSCDYENMKDDLLHKGDDGR